MTHAVAVAEAPASVPAISLQGVSVRFDELVALDEISLAVPAGTILGVIGPSGAGKTTAIKVLTGSLHPSTGTASVLGEDPQHFNRRIRSQIGYMPQVFVLYPDLTAAENVDFVASLASVFLSGLILDLNLFVPAVQVVGSLLPVTHGIVLMQGLFLRGQLPELWHLWVLGTIALTTSLLAWLLLRRSLAPRRA